ncbi:hypothetical protein BD309DRAFT_1013678 [Dichomitus squalens]|uniref:Uncharacterized protein n=1 Tax=Dichomitus squalens TaxID=114155 RepID=A0A4Q9MWI5_9APHY|nr:uncharacterized protein DICSQDRAFT_165503 [Dichomitus squalens LYAD-421 SS1]EJF65800.1 hypothetical protein DICSQDRAFT_165503 [Dichomitus squalens LYAD-421 SS1]TBU32434.1 hypothetical protein BD311DRAFT_804010 [Dichomitus squalens]TBU50709.1 hypothetical protein BD309DRAFT_1013678 [Dichomitus squalens]TBU65898.1 hypothetical protein BD310DRAFT_971945 [Dichomitus squalens]
MSDAVSRNWHDIGDIDDDVDAVLNHACIHFDAYVDFGIAVVNVQRLAGGSSSVHCTRALGKPAEKLSGPENEGDSNPNSEWEDDED